MAVYTLMIPVYLQNFIAKVMNIMMQMESIVLIVPIVKSVIKI